MSSILDFQKVYPYSEITYYVFRLDNLFVELTFFQIKSVIHKYRVSRTKKVHIYTYNSFIKPQNQSSDVNVPAVMYMYMHGTCRAFEKVLITTI